jgi:hypothetical protein
MSVDFRSPPAGSTHKRISRGVGRRQKSADVKQKTVTSIYTDPVLARMFFHDFKNAGKAESFPPVGLHQVGLIGTSPGACTKRTFYGLTLRIFVIS